MSETLKGVAATTGRKMLLRVGEMKMCINAKQKTKNFQLFSRCIRIVAVEFQRKSLEKFDSFKTFP